MNFSSLLISKVNQPQQLKSFTFFSGFKGRDHLIIRIDLLPLNEKKLFDDTSNAPFDLIAKSVEFVGCRIFLDFCRLYFINSGNNPRNWLEPDGFHHSAIILRELVLEIQSFITLETFAKQGVASCSAHSANFSKCYSEIELCHCRAVKTEKVARAIVFGAKDVDQIARETSAGTSCGNCRSDSQNIIDHLYGKPKLSIP